MVQILDSVLINVIAVFFLRKKPFFAWEKKKKRKVDKFENNGLGNTWKEEYIDLVRTRVILTAQRV